MAVTAGGKSYEEPDSRAKMPMDKLPDTRLGYAAGKCSYLIPPMSPSHVVLVT